MCLSIGELRLFTLQVISWIHLLILVMILVVFIVHYIVVCSFILSSTNIRNLLVIVLDMANFFLVLPVHPLLLWKVFFPVFSWLRPSFFFQYTIPLRIFCKYDLMTNHCFSVYLSWVALMFPWTCKRNFIGYSNPGWHYLPSGLEISPSMLS